MPMIVAVPPFFGFVSFDPGDDSLDLYLLAADIEATLRTLR